MRINSIKMILTQTQTSCVITILVSLFSLSGCQQSQKKSSQERPNIVFLISEDNSKHYMDLFYASGVETPHNARLAREGVVFNHAFSNSPVCSVARSTLITGTYATRTAMHLHRKIQSAPMPDGLEMFPAYLRKAGYYTTNKAKKDYNAIEGVGVWDVSSNEASWRNRTKGHPFFHQQTFTGSHESRLHFGDSLVQYYQPKDDPASVLLYPYYPDTDLFRFTVAYHRDKIRSIDERVGEVIQQLEEDDLLDDTFIFYFGDHGGVLPGSKGYLYETGLHVPLVVRIPDNWKHLVSYDAGTRSDDFVSFIDFAPTVLNLAGLPVPGQMDGKPFLGPGIDDNEIRDEALGYADRFDEKYEMVRSLRKGKWKYIRSFQPFYPDALHNNYRYKMLAFAEWREMFYQGKLDSLQSRFFLPKPVEMLFDLEQDPLELNNLAYNPAHREILIGMRNGLGRKLLAINDLGFLPESMLIDEAMVNPVKYGQSMHQQLMEILRINDLAFLPVEEAKKELTEVLQNGTALEKYWALNVGSVFGKRAAFLAPEVTRLIGNESKLVELKAIEFLGIAAGKNPFPLLVTFINSTEDPVEALQMLNTLVFFKDHSSHAFSVDIGQISLKKSISEVERRISYLKGAW